MPWYQGIEFNMAMRRLGKEAYMFNYNGQPHGLNNRDYMKHWTVHMDEFFDHYLLGKPRPAWMDNGVSYIDRGTRDVSGMFKKVVRTGQAGNSPEVPGFRCSGVPGSRITRASRTSESDTREPRNLRTPEPCWSPSTVSTRRFLCPTMKPPAPPDSILPPPSI